MTKKKTMTDLSRQVCVVLDHGMFVEVALRLARDVGKVYYVDPCAEQAFATIDHAIIGDGFEEIERVPEIWNVLDKVDFCVFPDVLHAGMQAHLANLGMPVWGSRRGDELELHKAAFRALQAKLGLEVPAYEVITGLAALRERCQDSSHDGEYIKITPQFRGNCETFKNRGWALTRELLDKMGGQFGAAQDVLRFLCEQPIEADLEGGLDTYTIDGQHPNLVVQGYEAKDKSYFAVLQPYEDVPEEIRSVSDKLWPIFKERGCRQMVSTEVKVTEDKRSFLLEPTVRFPSPAGEAQMELYGNFSQIIAAGAAGKLVEPYPAAHFACEAIIEHNGDKDRHRALVVPPKIRQWVKLYFCAQIGETLSIAPGEKAIGAVVGIGHTPADALDHLKEIAAELEDQPVTIHVDSLAVILQEIEEAQSQGLEFTDQKMPEPAEVIQ